MVFELNEQWVHNIELCLNESTKAYWKSDEYLMKVYLGNTMWIEWAYHIEMLSEWKVSKAYVLEVCWECFALPK